MRQKIPSLHFFYYCCFELQLEDSSLKAHKSHPQAGIHTLLSVGGDLVVRMHSKIAMLSLHPMFAVVFCCTGSAVLVPAGTTDWSCWYACVGDGVLFLE